MKSWRDMKLSELQAKFPSLAVDLKPSTDELNLNKWEAQYLDLLLADPSTKWLGVQSLQFKLGYRTTYTPDFIVVRNGGIEAHEVKGFMRDDAAVKIKTAARSFRWIKFVLVTRAGGQWQLNDVPP